MYIYLYALSITDWFSVDFVYQLVARNNGDRNNQTAINIIRVVTVWSL